MAQGSILSGVIQSPVDFVGALYRGQQMGQQRQAHEQNMLAGAQAMRMNDQSMQMRQQQISENDYQKALQRARVISNIARRARELPESERPAFAQSLNQDMLRSVGIDPAQVAEVDLSDRGLDAIIAQIGDVLPSDQSTVQSSQRLAGGITQSIDRNGNVVVRDASNRVLTGEDAIRAVQEAERREVDRQRELYSARQEGTLGAKLEMEPTLTDRNVRAKGEAENVTKTQKEYFDQIQSIDSNIENYAEGIRLLRDGANTGVVASRLPSLKAASIKLDNLRNRLGLDVVGSTTFGALSEAELAMALDTALPRNLQPEEMSVWLEERMAAQQKLRNVLDNALQFLSIPGNTLSDLRAMQKEQSAPSPRASAPRPATSRYQIEVMD